MPEYSGGFAGDRAGLMNLQSVLQGLAENTMRNRQMQMQEGQFQQQMGLQNKALENAIFQAQKGREFQAEQAGLGRSLQEKLTGQELTAQEREASANLLGSWGLSGTLGMMSPEDRTRTLNLLMGGASDISGGKMFGPMNMGQATSPAQVPGPMGPYNPGMGPQTQVTPFSQFDNLMTPQQMAMRRFFPSGSPAMQNQMFPMPPTGGNWDQLKNYVTGSGGGGQF